MGQVRPHTARPQVQSIITTMVPRPKDNQQLIIELRRPPIQHMPMMHGSFGGNKHTRGI